MTSNTASESLALIDPSAGTFSLVDPTAAHLRVDDLAPHRGDGIFETVLVTVHDGGGHVHARGPHFSRFRSSAQMLELPEPDERLWHEALDAVIAEHVSRHPDIEAFSVRYTMSRGVDHPSGWALSIPLDPAFARQRREGIAAITLDRGYVAYFGQNAPWMLVGAKTLSYAANQAAGRWAAAQGADEVLYVSHDGFVLEGPTSNVIVQRGNRLLTPDPKAGLLHGTTQQTVFARAAAAGFECTYADLRVEDLTAGDGVWLTSSARLCVPIRTLDGVELARNDELGTRMTDWVLQIDADSTQKV
ncbi:aminodeoxychorismate lyase [Brevibacterium daeguense]|uniref:Aminodeoxychorismate lyase n=1 Tax=Brevibacterium daeguense TaxID=909936 RepID=A0ABP8EHX4_9MICO|nr:aminodeoxychorismate lyase [Brevibacterium daeguense]